MIDFKCPHCGNSLRVKDSAVGMKGNCKKCGKPITVPDAADVPVEPQDDEWVDHEVEEEVEEAIEDYLPPPMPRRSKKKIEKKSQNSGTGSYMIGATVGGVCVLGLGICLGAWFLTGKSTPNMGSGQPQIAKPEVAKPKVSQERFEPLYRVTIELKAGQEVGIDRAKFGTLIQQFATELAIANDKAESPEEERVCSGYSDVLAIYKDAAQVWDVKISVPSLKHHAETYFDTFGRPSGSIEHITQLADFQIAIADGISLNRYPNFAVTGLDEIAARYAIPITEKDNYKTIPRGSVQLIWEKANEKLADVNKLRKT